MDRSGEPPRSHFRNRLIADAHPAGQLLLGQSPAFPQTADELLSFLGSYVFSSRHHGSTLCQNLSTLRSRSFRKTPVFSSARRRTVSWDQYSRALIPLHLIPLQPDFHLRSPPRLRFDLDGMRQFVQNPPAQIEPQTRGLLFSLPLYPVNPFQRRDTDLRRDSDPVSSMTRNIPAGSGQESSEGAVPRRAIPHLQERVPRLTDLHPPHSALTASASLI